VVPIRGVFVRDDTGTRRDACFFATNPDFDAATLTYLHFLIGHALSSELSHVKGQKSS